MISRKCLFAFYGLLICPYALQLHGQSDASNPLHLSPDHATVSVADWDRECQWYQSILGFTELKPAKLQPDRKICYLRIPGYRLDILWQQGTVRHSLRDQVAKDSVEQGWLNVEFKSPDLDRIFKYLTEKGILVKVDRGSDSSIQHLKFLDPEGNEIGIITP